MSTPVLIKVSPPPSTMGGVPDGSKGDIIVSGGGFTWTLNPSVVTSFIRTLLDDSSASAARSTLGLGGAALLNVGTSAGTVAAGDDSRFITDGTKADIIVSALGATWTITNNAVTLAKMATMATASFLGRNTAGTGNPEVLSVATVRTMLSIANVENTALSTWAGSANITTLGTIGTGVWNATPIAKSKLSGLDKFEITEASVASAATCDIGAATSDNVLITGTTGITSFGTGTAGIRRYVRFSSSLQITHNATSLILPGSANITVVAGDSLLAECLGSGNWKVLFFQKQDGTAIVGGGGAVTPTELSARLAGAFGGVTFDNTTINQRGYASLLDWQIGTGDFTIVAKIDVPTVVNAGNSPIWAFSSSNSTASAFACYARLEAATGSLQIFLTGTTQDSYRRLYFTNFFSTYTGQTIYLSLVRSSGTLTIYADSTDITASFSEFTNAGSGVMPTSWAESVVSSWLMVGGIGASGPSYAGKISRVTPFNFALTPTQLSAFRTGGVANDMQAPYVTGANLIISNERNSVFSKAATDWVASGGGTSISAAGAVVLGAASGSVSLSGPSGYMSQLVPGANYRLSFDISGGSFGANSVTAYFGVAVNDTTITAGTFNANGTYSFEFTPSFGVGVLSFIANIGGSSFSITNVKIVRVMVVNGSFESSGSPLASWTSVVAGSSTVTRDTTNQRSGTACAALNVVSGAVSAINQTVLTVGKRYHVSAYVKASVGGLQAAVADSSSSTNYLVINPTTSYVRYSGSFVAIGTVLQLKRATGTGDYTIYFDDVELFEEGCPADFSAYGLDNMTTLWRNGNPRFPDMALLNMVQDVSGNYLAIQPTEGKPWGAHGQLGRLARESGAQSLGGIVLPASTNQRLTISNAPSIGAGSFWIRQQVSIPSSLPGATRGLFCITPSATPGSGANVFLGYLGTDGHLYLILYGGSGTDYRQVVIYDVVTRYGGRVCDIVICRDSTNGTLLCWVNQERQFTLESVTGTPSTWIGSITSTYIHWFASSTSSVWQGEAYRVQIGRGILTDSYVRQLINSGVGTGAGLTGGTPISRAGIMASQDGLVIDNNLTQGWGTVYPDVAAVYSQGIAASNYVAVSNLGDEGHKNPSRPRALSYQDADRRFSGGSANGSTSVSAYGDALTVQGTPSSSAADANQPQCINVASAASVSSLAGYYSSQIHYVGRNPRLAMLVRLVELTNVAVWCGFHSGAANSLNNTDTPTALSAALFRFSPTRAGDTTWKCVTDDGAAQTTNDSLVVPTTNVTLFEIEIISGQRVKFYIDGRLVKTNTSNLPSPTATLRWQLVVEARDAVAHNIRFINEDTNS